MANDCLECGTYQVSEKLAAGLSTELREVLEPLLKEIESLNERIQEYDERMEKIAKEVYPEVFLLQQVKGVGTQMTTLTYVPDDRGPVSVREESRGGLFSSGLKPGRRNSGKSEPQKHISKEGDRYLRTMMVQARRTRLLGPFGEDSDLRRWGLKLAERGGKCQEAEGSSGRGSASWRVLLHRLWVSERVYESLHQYHKKPCCRGLKVLIPTAELNRRV